MSIAVTNILKDGVVSSASSKATASWTPTAGRMYLVTLVTRTGITADPVQPTASGNGQTWTVVASVVFDTTSSSRRRVTVFRCIAASPSAGALTFDQGGQLQTSWEWNIDEVTGMDTSGTNGAGAIVQSVTNIDSSGTATGITGTLAAFGSVNNGTYGAFGNGNPAGGGFTAGSGFTFTCNQSIGGESQISVEYKTTNDTTVDMTSSTGGEIGVIAIELKAAAAGAVINPGFFQLA